MSRDLKEMREQAMRTSGDRALQAKGMAGARAEVNMLGMFQEQQRCSWAAGGERGEREQRALYLVHLETPAFQDSGLLRIPEFRHSMR